MTLELEKLTNEIETMAQGAYRRREATNAVLEELMRRLRAHRTAWDTLEEALGRAMRELDMKWYRAARPLDDREPLDAVVPPPHPPAEATLVAGDGSQILPNRHGAYLYSVINVGVIVYYHGRGQAPFQTTYPTLDYPNGDHPDEDTFVDKGAIINLRRDKAEIETLVEVAYDYLDESCPVLALLDQRLLYWPVGSSGAEEGQRVLLSWQQAMSRACDGGILLAGYIVRPAKRSVLTMLRTLDILRPAFDKTQLEQGGREPGLTDAALFRRLLVEPGHRSKVFVDVSQHNNDFRSRDPRNEVCFFYLNPGRSGRQIARVDIPYCVAEDPAQLEMVHGLIYNQCQIMGDYPYVLTRADELAVISGRDRENLDVMIGNAMEKYGLGAAVTAKESGKQVARAGRTRHDGLRRR
ncbi:MAG: DNA double-strand break repair nuclease NurA [Candidatus Promineifilaceae bacterium]|nr:DNA double-strand break repair nuclease NurA [Candidatus Promineifilaceae bacterium]